MSMPLTPARNPNSVAAVNDRMASLAINRAFYQTVKPTTPRMTSFKATVMSISRFEDGGHFVRLDTRRDGEIVVFLDPKKEDLFAAVNAAHANATCHEFLIDDDGAHRLMRGRIIAICA